MIYLDNAATSFHKPDCVLRAVVAVLCWGGSHAACRKQRKGQQQRSNGSLKAYFQYKMPDRGDV